MSNPFLENTFLNNPFQDTNIYNQQFIEKNIKFIDISILEKWITIIDNQFSDENEYTIYNHVLISFKKDYKYNLIYLINHIIDKNIIEKDNYINLLITTLILLKRLQKTNIFHKCMMYKIILGLFIISEKINNDELYDNYTWANCNNISLKDINLIELTLLSYLNFNTFINRTEFLNHYLSIFI